MGAGGRAAGCGVGGQQEAEGQAEEDDVGRWEGLGWFSES